MDGLTTQEMPKYIGVKQVRAREMTKRAYNELRGWPMPEDENPSDPGYLVVYPDGYKSWCPKKQFEEANRPINAMTFGHAVEAMKKGAKVARRGWNGKGMFVYYVPENQYPADGNKLGTMKGVFPDDMVPYGAYIAMKTAQDNVVPWLASQTDVLAEDWEIVE